MVPKADILRNVWDPHHEGDLNVVEVYVGYLRRKIDAPFGRRALQTVRGAGYRLAADGGYGVAPAFGGGGLEPGRARLTVVATVLLGVGIAAGAALLAATVSRTLQEAVDSGALQSAREVAALVDADVLPDPVPVGGEGTAAIQVVDAQGRVRAASASTDRLVPVLQPAELARVRAGERLVIDGDRLGLDGPLRVVGVPAGPAGDRQTVLVAVDYGSARSGARLLVIGLAVGAPLLLAVVALATWEVAGRALRPGGGAAPRRAEEITGSGASRRLPLPAARDELHRLAVTLNDMLARLDAGRRPAAGVRLRRGARAARRRSRSARTQLEVAARLDAGTPAGELAEDVLHRRGAAGPAGRRPAAAGPAGRGAGAGAPGAGRRWARWRPRWSAATRPPGPGAAVDRAGGPSGGRGSGRAAAGAGQPGGQRGPVRAVAGHAWRSRRRRPGRW